MNFIGQFGIWSILLLVYLFVNSTVLTYMKNPLTPNSAHKFSQNVSQNMAKKLARNSAKKVGQKLTNKLGLKLNSQKLSKKLDQTI